MEIGSDPHFVFSGALPVLILKLVLTIQRSNYTLEHLSQINENLCFHNTKNKQIFMAALFGILQTGNTQSP